MRMAELKNHAMRLDTAKEIAPLFTPEAKRIEGFKAIWNTGKDKIATIVSDRYNLVQHKTVIDAVADAISNLNISANANVRDSGNKVFVDIEFDQAKLYIDENEEFIGGIRIINSYDKSTGIIVAPRLLRLACMNGMVVDKGFVSGYQIKHTTKLTEDFEGIISSMIKDMINSNEKLKAMVNDCIGDSIEWELMDRILNSLSGGKKHFEALKEILVKVENPTRWDLYNSFTSYATHDAQLRPAVEQRLQKIAQKVLVTHSQVLDPKKEV